VLELIAELGFDGGKTLIYDARMSVRYTSSSSHVPQGVAKLDREWAHLTAFDDFRAEHCRHLRTSNAIESSFATVKLRARDEGPQDRRRPRSRSPTSCSRWRRSAGGGSTATSVAEAALVAAGQLAAVQRDRRDLLVVDAHLHAPADQPGVERVVIGVDADVRIGRNPKRPAPLAGGWVGQWPHQLMFLGEQVDRTAAQCAMQPPVRATLKPAVQLVLKVVVVSERTARLEARLEAALQSLDDALGLRISRLAEVPTHLQLAAERRESVGRPAAAGVQ
jgi:hypothetical protein